jgi:flagellar hook protein FlgE
MTLNNTLNIGVSGLLAQSGKIGSISNNISNVNTVGYKGFTTDFLAIVQSSENPLFNSFNGAQQSVRQINSRQGLISSSDNVTDIAVNGNGLFIVSDDATSATPFRYTRAGAFSPDKDGNLRNSAGFYLQGWPLDSTSPLSAALQSANFGVGNLRPINVAATDSVAAATNIASIKANLNADEVIYNPAGNITFTNNPTSGDSININGVDWTFVTSGATGNQTNIGISLDATLTQLVTDLNADTASSNPLKNTGLVTNPIAGSTITINGTTRTFVASGATGNQTNIGATLDDTLAQLAIDTGISLNPLLAGATYTNISGTKLGITYTAPPSYQLPLTQPTAGTKVNINGVLWEFVASGATDHQTNIGANLDATLTQWAADLNASTNQSLSTSTYSNAGGTALSVASVGSPATFAFSSASVNGVASPLLLYNSAIAANSITGGAIPANFNKLADIVDNNGVSHTINIYFLKTATNSWSVEIAAVPATDITTAGGQIATGTMTFNGDGTLASVTPSLTNPINFPWTSTGTIPDGSTVATVNNAVTFNWGTAGQAFGTVGATIIAQTDGMRQLAGKYQVDSLTQDGHASGTLQKIEINDRGIVTGFYSNATTQELFVIPLAKFNNPDGLENISGTAYIDSETSGFINIFASGQGGVGAILSGSLENSNVDLSSQLTDIIIAQRAYQSNTKIITTSDDMLQTITDMLR